MRRRGAIFTMGPASACGSALGLARRPAGAVRPGCRKPGAVSARPSGAGWLPASRSRRQGRGAAPISWSAQTRTVAQARTARSLAAAMSRMVSPKQKNRPATASARPRPAAPNAAPGTPVRAINPASPDRAWSPRRPPRPAANGQLAGMGKAAAASANPVTPASPAIRRSQPSMAGRPRAPRTIRIRPQASSPSAAVAPAHPNACNNRSAADAPGVPSQLATARPVAALTLGSSGSWLSTAISAPAPSTVSAPPSTRARACAHQPGGGVAGVVSGYGKRPGAVIAA